MSARAKIEGLTNSWYGFALGVLKTQLHEARDACKKALEMEFYNADYHANLGFVYMQAGLTSTAMESFEEALKWDPDHPTALRYLKTAKNPKAAAPGGVKPKSGGGGGLFGLFRRSAAEEKPEKSTVVVKRHGPSRSTRRS